MDNLGAAPQNSCSIWSDITFHPNSILIAKRCKQANENASKQLILNMEKLEIEQQKACQRVEKEQDQLCQKILNSNERIRRVSEIPEPNYAKRVQRSKTMDLRSVCPLLQLPTKGTDIRFDEITHFSRRTVSFKTPRTSLGLSTNTNSYRSTSVCSEQTKIDQTKKLAPEESQPEWQVALAAKRRQKLNQLQIFREFGHWGEDGCQTATAMLTGCSFNPAISSSAALSHTSELDASSNEDEGKNSI